MQIARVQIQLADKPCMHLFFQALRWGSKIILTILKTVVFL